MVVSAVICFIHNPFWVSDVSCAKVIIVHDIANGSWYGHITDTGILPRFDVNHNGKPSYKLFAKIDNIAIF